MSFKNITPEEYQRLINNKNRIFDLTFKTPEALNKYRNDKDIYEEIKYSEKQNRKLKDYDKVFHENLDKYFIENKHKKIDEISRYNYNIIKNQENKLEELNRELEDKDNKIVNIEDKSIRNKYGNKYKFDDDIDISKSFETIFNENNISYKPYKKSRKTEIQYLLNKLENDTREDKKLYNHFYNILKNKKKLSLKIPTKNIIDQQNGEGLLNTNKIKINTDLLNKNILSIRYLTGKN